jgi:PKD repeat protein
VITVSTADSTDLDDGIAGSSIDFGDGTVVRAFSASHTYIAGGVYAVTAIVADAAGQQSRATATVTIGDFGLNISKQNGTVTPSQPATFLITVIPRLQFGGSITLGCSGLPAGYSCTFSPDAVAPGASPASSTLTISAPMAAARMAAPAPLFALWLPFCGFVTLGSFHVRRRGMGWLVVGCGLLAIISVISCGGGSQRQSATAPSNTAIFTVTATAGPLQHSAASSVILP